MGGTATLIPTGVFGHASVPPRHSPPRCPAVPAANRVMPGRPDPRRGRRPSPRARRFPVSFLVHGRCSQRARPSAGHEERDCREKRRDQAGSGARASPFAAARARRERRRDGAAVRRRRQCLQRSRPRTPPPAQRRRRGQGRRALGRRRAPGVRRHGHLRRARDEPPRHALLAAQPRAHRRHRRVDDHRSRLRRAGPGAVLRQDRARHAHGRDAAQRAGDHGRRRRDARRPPPGAHARPQQRLRGRGHSTRRASSTTRASRPSSATPALRADRARACSPPTP